MYDVINMLWPDSAITENAENASHDCDKLYTEAVFSDGKKKLDKILELFTKLKNKLDALTDAQSKSDTDKKGGLTVAFNPKGYWRDPLWKELEDEIIKLFGFRSASIQPYQEKWNSKSKDFESKELNAFVYRMDRYPIEGLVTDKGFYDNTHSLIFEMVISLGLLKALTPSEIVGVFLHEFGHAIDPALVDISYTETNILSKYLTDRKNKINKAEAKVIREHKQISRFKLLGLRVISNVKSGLFDVFMSKDKTAKKNLEKLKAELRKDNSVFTRQEFSEAYADNFARMYGFGVPLINGLKKIDKHYDDLYTSRIKKEKVRQQLILAITSSALKDVHKTDIHRLRALQREYEADINDPATPEPVKKQLKDDLDELLKVYESFTKDFSDLQNNVNVLIYQELMNLDEKEAKKTEKKDEKK